MSQPEQSNQESTGHGQLNDGDFRRFSGRNRKHVDYSLLNSIGMDQDQAEIKEIEKTNDSGRRKRKSDGEVKQEPMKRAKISTEKKARPKRKPPKKNPTKAAPAKKTSARNTVERSQPARKTITRTRQSQPTGDPDEEIAEHGENETDTAGDVFHSSVPDEVPPRSSASFQGRKDQPGHIEGQVNQSDVDGAPSSPLSDARSDISDTPPLERAQYHHTESSIDENTTAKSPTPLPESTSSDQEHHSIPPPPPSQLQQELLPSKEDASQLPAVLSTPSARTEVRRSGRNRKATKPFDGFISIPPVDVLEHDDATIVDAPVEQNEKSGIDAHANAQDQEFIEEREQMDDGEDKNLTELEEPSSFLSEQQTTNPGLGKQYPRPVPDAPLADAGQLENHVQSSSSALHGIMEDLVPDELQSTSMSTPAPKKRSRLGSIMPGSRSQQRHFDRTPVDTSSRTMALVLSPAKANLLQTPISIPKAPRKRAVASSALQGGLPSPPNSRPDALEVNAALAHAHANPALLALSAKLSARAPLAEKPLPQGQPLVWADSRQALCETVPYFRMPQSGCHQNDRHVYAFLFDGVGHCREYMDSDVIIARAGGGMEADSTGQLVQKKDHLMRESQVQSVLNDIEHQNPLIIICGNKNEGSVVKMPHRYNVLGWYKPVAVWAERTLGKGKKMWTTIKYRFERLDSQKPAWHTPEQPLLSLEERQTAGPLTSQSCIHCDHHYPTIYLIGWMCLNPSCHAFWRPGGGQDAPLGRLLYNPAFLLSRNPWQCEEEPYSVRPLVPQVGKVVGDNLTHINTRGICCPQCGRCSSRRLFRGWKCDNSNCNYEKFPKHIPVKVPMLHQPWESTGEGPTLARNKHEKVQGVHVSVSHTHGFKVYTYTFDGINGKFVHAISNAKINRQPGGPDEMFAAMQNQDDPEMNLRLERRRFGVERGAGSKVDALVQTPAKKKSPPSTNRTSFIASYPTPGDESSLLPSPPLDFPSMSDSQQLQTPGVNPATSDTANIVPPVEIPTDDPLKKSDLEDGDFMTAFSMNYGMPYKFVASGASLPFTNSPWPVRATRADLNWASQNFLDPAGHTDLNELLIFAYMEGQKIEYHDDGESGLGPRIATLSLGGKAQMHMRMKMKHYVGCSKTGIFTAERPVPGSIDGPEMYEKRLAAWEELQGLKASDKPAYERRRKELPRELGMFEKRAKKAGDLVTVTLNHGDVVLMEGYEIQQYLEHKVVPEGFLRFALTCRTVLPQHLRVEERPVYGEERDEEGMSCFRRMAEGGGEG